MTDPRSGVQFHHLRTPRSAAVAGIIFGVLFATSIILLATAIPATTAAPWVRGGSRIATALSLAPIAGIAFLWFIGVLRDRFGDLEDRFFATVFLGSGLLFLAMTFVSMTLAGALYTVSRHSTSSQDEIVYFGREVMLHLNNVYAIRMAAVFMISLATMWLRTRLMPRPLVIATYLLALILLVVVSFSIWVTLVVPVWVLVVSVYILVTDHRQPTHPD
jgi:Na+/phosphate symporter